MGVPKVSVIIPVYNTEKYLSECLDSVLNQTFKDIEVICIDDGSEDGSLEILKVYSKKDSRVKYLNQNHKGGGAARNLALDVAQGAYLAFLDSDDFYNMDYIEKMYSKAINTNADIVICGACSYDNKEHIYQEMPWALVEENLPNKDVFNYHDMTKFIFNSFQNWNWNKLFRKQFIDDNNIRFQEIYRTNDLLFTCKALVLADRITTIKEFLVNYRINILSCQSSNYLYPIDFYKAFKALRDFLIEKNMYNELEESYLDWLLSGVLYNVRTQKNFQDKDLIIKTILNDREILALYDENVCLIGNKKYREFNILIHDYYGRKFRIIYILKQFCQRIFSITNINNYKVITILGIKFKTKLKRSENNAKS